jgi:hypothetical protein
MVLTNVKTMDIFGINYKQITEEEQVLQVDCEDEISDDYTKKEFLQLKPKYILVDGILYQKNNTKNNR